MRQTDKPAVAFSNISIEVAGVIPQQTSKQHVIDTVRHRSFIKRKVIAIPQLAASEKDKNKYRGLWLLAVAKNGVNDARKHKFGHVYAWLYRHDKLWLLQVNKHNKAPNIIKNPRIDWSKRDRHLVKLLCHIKNDSELKLDDPRHSMNWYLSKLYREATVGKHLSELPLCKLFFLRFCENIAEYQIRRITCAAIKQSFTDSALRRWKILRMSGLSEHRLTPLADAFLLNILRI